ncbi:MAG: NAD(P)H-dependent oxidoreductase [Bacteroidia bacterium]
MITIISATNRPNSSTLKVAKHYQQLMEQKGEQTQLFSLEKLPVDIAFNELYDKRSAAFQQILDTYIAPIQKFVVVMPEYNGSFPGILKLFIDAIHPDLLRRKKVALLGVSSGRAGNLRGMEHLTGVFNYLGVFVHPNRLPVSSVLTLLDDKGAIKDTTTLTVLEKHIVDVVAW